MSSGGSALPIINAMASFPESKSENVIARETLKEGGLPQRYGTILVRMEKTSLRRIEASTRNGGRHRIPSHTSINVFKSITILVTG